MELLKDLLDTLLHIDEKLNDWIAAYGTLTYAILFLIVFVETGLIVMPLLPGDSLLFTAGMFCAVPDPTLKIAVVIPLLIVAALMGDNVNYAVGRFFSAQVKKRKRILFFKREYIEKTEAFYEKHGGRTVILARFVPIVRTVAPFVAGASNMPYVRYIAYCIGGAVLWVGSITTLGYLFGNIPIIRENFEFVVLGIVVVSLLPILFGWIRSRSNKKKAA